MLSSRPNPIPSNISTVLVSCAAFVALQACTPTSSPSEAPEDQGVIDALDMAATDFGEVEDSADDRVAEPEDMRSSAPDASSTIDMQDPEDASADVDASVSDMDSGQEPAPPAALQRWLVGDPADAMVTPLGPAFILMGGGADVDEAFQWWKPYHAGGDVVVLRASGADGYNDYLYQEIGGVDSVETLLVDTRELADSAYVAWRVERAEAIFIAGGDQSKYLSQWRDTALQGALERALQRGAAIGGTSAGCAIMGGFIYAANEGTIYSDEALADPYDMRLTLEREFLTTTTLVDVITDTHFYERDRLGRLIAFVARLREDGWSQRPLGVGVDEGTALVVAPDGMASVLGQGYVYIVDGSLEPTTCEADTPLEFTALPYTRLDPGEPFSLLTRQDLSFDRTVDVSGGELISDDLY